MCFLPDFLPILNNWLGFQGFYTQVRDDVFSRYLLISIILTNFGWCFSLQRCNPDYYPYGFVGKYLDDLDDAVDSTGTLVKLIQDNLSLLEEECGRNYDDVVPLVESMNVNLKRLRTKADQSLDLVKCKNINELYVNTMHEAACTYSVDALAWIFASSLIISVCGLIMIMLRSAYYPEQHLELSGSWIKTPSGAKIPTNSGETHTASTLSTHQAVPQSVKVLHVHSNEFEVGDEF